MIYCLDNGVHHKPDVVAFEESSSIANILTASTDSVILTATLSDEDATYGELEIPGGTIVEPTADPVITIKTNAGAGKVALFPGRSVPLKVEADFGEDGKMDVTDSVTGWSSSDSEIVSVDRVTGVATAVNNVGSVEISAIYNGQDFVIPATVNSLDLADLNIAVAQQSVGGPESLMVPKGSSIALTASGTLLTDNPEPQDLTQLVSWDADVADEVATIVSRTPSGSGVLNVKHGAEVGTTITVDASLAGSVSNPLVFTVDNLPVVKGIEVRNDVNGAADSAYVLVGQDIQLKVCSVTSTPVSGCLPVNGEVTWETEHGQSTVDHNGKVTAAASGEIVPVTATMDGFAPDTIFVYVLEESDFKVVSVDAEAPNMLLIGNSRNLKTVQVSDPVVDLSDYVSLKEGSGNQSVLSVDSQQKTVTGVATGSDSVVATWGGVDSGESQSLALNVEDAAIYTGQEIEIRNDVNGAADSAYTLVGQDIQLKACLIEGQTEADCVPVGADLVWSVTLGNSTVDQNGKVTGAANGEIATVSASLGGYEVDSIEVTVLGENDFKVVTVNENYPNLLLVGVTRDLKTIQASNPDVDLSDYVTLKENSGSKDILSVDSELKTVTGVATGVDLVIATWGDTEKSTTDDRRLSLTVQEAFDTTQYVAVAKGGSHGSKDLVGIPLFSGSVGESRDYTFDLSAHHIHVRSGQSLGKAADVTWAIQGSDHPGLSIVNGSQLVTDADLLVDGTYTVVGTVTPEEPGNETVTTAPLEVVVQQYWPAAVKINNITEGDVTIHNPAILTLEEVVVDVNGELGENVPVTDLTEYTFDDGKSKGQFTKLADGTVKYGSTRSGRASIVAIKEVRGVNAENNFTDVITGSLVVHVVVGI